MQNSIIKYYFFLLLFGFTSLGFTQVYTVKTVPNSKTNNNTWVSDPNNVLNFKDKAKLNQLISEIESTSSAEIAVVILPSIGKEVPKMFAVDLFKEWGIGKANKDNGLLILTVMDQRRTEFETGYGLEAILTDAMCYRIASQELVPHFKKGNFGKGLVAGVTRIQQILNKPEAIKEIYDDGVSVNYVAEINPVWYFLFAYITAMLFVLFYYFSNTKQIHKNKEDFYDKFQDLYEIKHWFYMLLFPLPFILIRLLFVKYRLSKYRTHKRFSKINGKEMFLKNEIEDDFFLKKGQIVEEELNTIDYDVWVTKDEDDILILPYIKPFSKYKICPECAFKTYHKAHTQTVSYATTYSSGLREETHKCKNCDYQHIVSITIPMITKSSSSSSGSFGGGGFSGGSFGGGSSGGGGAGVSW